MTRLTRRYEFSAAHVLARTDWSAAENQRVYGKCANPAGHGHNYTLELTLEGEVEASSGHLVELGRLDRAVAARVVAALGDKFLNREVSAFEKVVPTAENIAKHIWDTLASEVGPARLHSVRLIETRKNSVEYRGGEEST